MRLGTNSLVRRNIALKRREAHRLEVLKDMTEASSDSKVVRDALLVFEDLVDTARSGNRLVTVSAEGGKEEVFDVLKVSEPDDSPGEFVQRNLMIHERSVRRLDALQAALGASTTSQVVRLALNVYDKVTEIMVSGGKLIAYGPDQSKTLLRWPVSRSGKDLEASELSQPEQAVEAATP